jgi:sugar O-acyltransferase (sialic acid O-acetyltransferase NeuD family)
MAGKPVWIIGAGGHAKVVIATLRAAGEAEIAGVIDDDPRRLGERVLGVPVVGDTTPATIARLGIRRAVIAIGANQARAAVARRCDGLIAWVGAVHPRAYVAPEVSIGEGTLICAGAIVQPDASIGRHAIVNTASSVDHDATVGDLVHIAPGSRLAGGVHVGTGSLIGLGAVLLPGRVVGSWATVAAGAVVARDVADGAVVAGVPAQLLHDRPETLMRTSDRI